MSMMMMHHAGSVSKSIPDFSGFGLTRMFALFKTKEAIYNYPIKIYDSVGDRDLYVFFDDKNEISENSPLSTTTTPTSEVLGDLISGTIDIEVISIFCLISGLECVKNNASSYVGAASYIVMGGSIVKFHGRVSLYFPSGKGGYIANPITEFNGSFSINSIAANRVGTEVGGFGFVVSTNPTSWTGFRHSHNTYSVPNNITLYRTASTAEISSLGFLPRDYNLLSSTIHKNSEVKAYLNSELQGSDSTSGSLVNNIKFIIGRGYTGQGIESGYLGFISVNVGVNSQLEINNLKTQLDNYFY